jgi:hypothetical protein
MQMSIRQSLACLAATFSYTSYGSPSPCALATSRQYGSSTALRAFKQSSLSKNHCRLSQPEPQILLGDRSLIVGKLRGRFCKALLTANKLCNRRPLSRTREVDPAVRWAGGVATSLCRLHGATLPFSSTLKRRQPGRLGGVVGNAAGMDTTAALARSDAPKPKTRR